MHMYHEGVVSRGSNEVASRISTHNCLITLVTAVENRIEIIIWSACGYTLWHVVTCQGRRTEFMMSGHLFSLITLCNWTSKEAVYIPDEWYKKV